MSACTQSGGYKVNGVAEGFSDGDTLYFFSTMGNEQPTDTIIVSDGKFTLQGASDSVKLCSVVAADGSAGAIFFNEAGSIDITLSRVNPSKVSGTKANDGWQRLTELQADYTERLDSLTTPLYADSVSDETRQAILARYQAAEKELMGKVIGIAEENLDNALGFFVVTSLAGGDDLTADRLKSMIEKMPAEFRQRQEIVQIEKSLAASESTAVGKTMPDFTMPTLSGESLSALSEVAKNKVTILDFWASWCGPCCEEMPSMVSLYAKYHDKGLGILGISLDNEKEAWTKAVSDMGMTWTQVSELNGWNTRAVELFQVRAIPFMVVVDQKGTILEKGLRGPALEQFVSKQLQ